MSKLYFPKVYRYTVSENLLFISWLNYFQCFDFVTGESQFKLDHGFWFLKSIDNKLFGQKENGADILVYDLKGNLIRTISGNFYLWKVKQDDQFLFVPGKDEKNERLGFKIDIPTLTIVDKLEAYDNPQLVKENLGFYWLGNNVYCYNIFTGDTIWTYDLGTGITPESDHCFLDNDNLIITSSDSRLISLSTENGECLWQKKTALHFYTMHPVNKNLYGFGSRLFEVIDSKTGELIFTMEFPNVNEIFDNSLASAYNEVREDGFYLIGDRKFGKINIPGHEIEFVSDFDIPEGTRLFKPSFPHRNCYFALDENENLHVYRPLKK
jgi:outer membrane protein assembly factor BamB